jgi:hypothetical protein
MMEGHRSAHTFRLVINIIITTRSGQAANYWQRNSRIASRSATGQQ